MERRRLDSDWQSPWWQDRTIGGGVPCGGAIAVGARLLVDRTDDHLVEITWRGEAAIRGFWEYAAFVANSLVFLLIGMHEANRDFRAVWVVITLAIGLVHQHVLYWGDAGRGRLGSRARTTT
ncbi:hypothetical protein [Nevskia soli]|jgi:NhaP-type Na+/H+ or K+/H+ antiporter|uniref:hypothetical protein n=1 Tax=Nevskia soli TaxID=418856 RepID=UPI0015D7FFC7|nr:hypothetical protein [Nevskia soli]